jgi:phosphopantothenoylcysteine decarboxylase/phosphopantothenate--cysteine ligase
MARDTDLVVVAPATADLIARMAGGHANDLADRRPARDRQDRS